MTTPHTDHRFRADFPEGTVVSLIGMRVNRWRSVRAWFPVFTAMPRMLKELFGLSISEGAIANAFRRMGTAFDTACAAIKVKLLSAPVIASVNFATRVWLTSSTVGSGTRVSF